jgi:NADH dehydrogenase
MMTTPPQQQQQQQQQVVEEKEHLEFQRKDPQTAKRVLILGAGFAGLTTAKTLCSRLPRRALSKGAVEVLLVNRWNYHLFTPLLYQASTGLVDMDSIAQEIRPEARKSGFRFLESEVESIDVRARIVYTGERAIPYDYLVIALGSVKDESKLEGREESAIPLKTLEDGYRIHNRIIRSFEKASGIVPGPERDAYLNFVVIGGSTGAELCGSLIDYVNAVSKLYPNIDLKRHCRVYLIEADERLFPSHTRCLSSIVLDSLRSRGVRVLLDTRAERVEGENRIVLSSGESITSWNIFDNTGTKPNPVLETMPEDIVKKERGKLVVDRNLKLPNFPNVFAIGDNAKVIIGRSKEGAPRHAPPTAEAAVEEGKYAGRLIAAELRYFLRTGRAINLRALPFHFREKGVMLSIGAHTGIAKFPWHTFTGLMGWLIWRVVHLYLIATARAKVAVALDWTLDVFSGRNTSQLATVREGSKSSGELVKSAK